MRHLDVVWEGSNSSYTVNLVAIGQVATGGNRAGPAGAFGCVYADTIGQRERPTRPLLPRLVSGKVGGICC